MKKEMLINVLQPEECRIAIIENGVLEELYVERTSHESYTGNIYKGKVVNLEPAIQAAFVDFSVGRNGFLHVSDVEPQYYDRHQEGGDEADLGAEPGAGPRPREPRRDRDDRRRPKADPDLGPTSFPPRAEDRLRDRPERERPDRSVKGQRDRSESPRRFGEGLVDDRDQPAAPPSLPEPPPRAADVREPEQRAAAGRDEGPTSWSQPVGFDWGVERERDRDRPRERERDFGPAEPVDPLWGRSRTGAEPVDPDLPPSRTQGRKRPPTSSDPDFEFDDRGRPRSLFGAPEPTVERAERAEPQDVDPESPASGRREPRRGRGRGRSPSQPAAQRPAPPANQDVEPDEIELGLEAAEEFSAPEPDEFPRRRGGRAAIRSRGGDRPEPERPREHQPPERPSRPAPAPIEPEAAPFRPESLDRPTEPERDRPRPHNRAGEPGYVPRRERQKGVEPEFGARPGPRAPEPDDRRFDPLAELDQRDLAGADDEGESEAGSAQAKTEGRRRRRRRGRKRDRPEGEPTTGREPEVFDAEFDEPTGFREPAPAFARGDDLHDDLHDDLDLELDELEEVDDLDDDLHAEAPRPAVEEEIDPELEQEIRREIEEIEELEREMGLRGPVEARPRRGDAAGAGKFGRGRGLVKPPLQEIFRRGDEVLVQVIKESIGTKGPTLSTYISIPGRYLVLMPGLNRVGVSRKIVDEGQRRKLREIMHELNPPKGLGFIVRTAGLERTKRELARDLAYLLRLWKVILRRIKKAKSPAPIYQESDMITRTIRDIFTSEIDTIWIDEPAAFERAQEFLRVVMPRFVNRVKLYDEKVPLFHKYGIEDEIAKIQRRHVPLPEGGSIVIDQTEALVAIDVNSGNFRVEDDAERTAYEMNLRAAKEIARQLRLRDLGGVIVNDFIDMREERHRRGVERALREAIKRDRARTKILRMSAFGLIEMTRQRIRPSLKRSVYEDCSHCTGAGVLKTAESMAIDVMRLLALASHREDIRRINVTVGPNVAMYLNNRKRKEIARIENESGMSVQVQFKDHVAAEHLQIECFDANGGEVRLIPAPAPGHRRGH